MCQSFVDYSSCKAGKAGSKLGICGVRFNLSPMSDQFSEIILSAIKQVNLDSVWAHTDHVSTVYRGKKEAIFDAVKACYLYAYQEGIHIHFEATFSKGCPGDTDADYTLTLENQRPNQSQVKEIRFPVIGKFAVYPMGSDAYMTDIETVINKGVEQGLVSGSSHYCTLLSGDIHAIFQYLEDTFSFLEQSVNHFIIQVTLLCNTPQGEII